MPTMLGHYGVVQAAGYTVETWNGAAGWGSLAQWESLPGRYTLAEAVWLNGQAIRAELNDLDPLSVKFNYTYDEAGDDGRGLENFIETARKAGLKVSEGDGSRELGLLWDRDTFAFYGDPALAVRLPAPKGDQVYSTRFEQVGSDRFRFIVRVNDAGTARQNKRPVGAIFTRRLAGVKIISGKEYAPVVGENFILVRKARPEGDERELVVEFEGEPQSDVSGSR